MPPIERVSVVLSLGRRRRLPATAERRAAWPGRPCSGSHFRVDAVYQRTVGELRARGRTRQALAIQPIHASRASRESVDNRAPAERRSTRRPPSGARPGGGHRAALDPASAEGRTIHRPPRRAPRRPATGGQGREGAQKGAHRVELGL
ncbi:uncharacterized protein SOCEGT47_037360 [Sorangium cellulosum]|uniref:Uncharacterized protein n=1 Tax=Sorangium cellulosum TaxID=56 RepID=A0A4P2Q2W7_SORCE|nr:uncharacterized protein SOCEGT47_037360 [Sorangium cellulosum]